MDLALTSEDGAFREHVRSWLIRNIPVELSTKVFAGAELDGEDHRSWARILGMKGWLCPSWPRQFGGPGWTPLQQYLFREELSLAGAPTILPFGPTMVAPVIQEFGSDAQRTRFLPGIASGEVWWSQGYSEPGAGSDLAAVKTRAQRRGDRYVVNGQKAWTSLAQHGDWMFTLVRTRSEGKPQAGISFLLIDMRTPGLTIRPIKLLDASHEVNEVFFDNVEVPVENLVGEENEGWTYAKYLLEHERTGIADIHRAKRELERLKRIARSEGLWNDCRFRDEIAKLEVDVIGLDMLVLRTTLGKDAAPDIVGILKILGSELQQRYSELMMLAGGPHALPRNREAAAAGWQPAMDSREKLISPLAQAYFNMRKTTIYGGSNEVQRNLIARAVLG